MAKITRFNGNLQAPASAALGTERTVFGETTQSNDLTDQFTADLLRGWGVVGPSDEPTLQDFNAMGYTLGQLHAYLHQVGVPEYNAAQEYHLNSIANESGVIYVSLINTNVGNAPSSSPSRWRELYPQATEAVRGSAKIATNTQALAGVDNTTIMTPLKVSQAISVTPLPQATEAVRGSAKIATNTQALAGVDNTTIMTPLKVSQAISVTPLPLGYLSGFAQANNSGSPITKVNVGAGAARSSDNTVNITLTGTITSVLQLVGPWEAGTDKSKLDTGGRDINKTYHAFVIGHPTLDDDVIYSLSATAPALPSGYAGFRRIGRIVTDGSGNIRRFFSRGEGYYDWLDPIVEVTASGVANNSSLLTLTGLGGAPVRALVNFIVQGDGVCFRALPSDVTNSAINSTVTTYNGGAIGETSAGSDSGAGMANVVTDTSGQIRIAFRTSIGNVSYRLLNMGYQEIL